MFERFTDRARRVVVLAQEEARLLNHNYIGTEHLLLGLVHEGEGVAAQAVRALGIELTDVRAQVEAIIGRGGTTPSGHIPFTPRAKTVLELSLREALQLGHNYIGTEHILLGLIREGEGVGAQVLTTAGVDLSRARQTVVQMLSGVGSPPGTTGIVSMGGPGSTRLAGSVCSFCERDLWEVDRYVIGPGAAICDQCASSVGETFASQVDERVLRLPPRVFGDAPQESAQAVVDVVVAVVGGSDVANRTALLEDGSRLLPLLDTARKRFEVGPESVRVERVRFVGDDAADVRFSVFANINTVTVDGRVTRADGSWRLTGETCRQLLLLAGVEPPPAGR